MNNLFPLALLAGAAYTARRVNGQRNVGTSDRSDRRVFRVAPWSNTPTEADDEHCPVCNERYRDFRPGISYAQAEAYLRAEGGETRDVDQEVRRSDVLRMLGKLKREAWRERHGGCQFEPEDLDDSWDDGWWDALDAAVVRGAGKQLITFPTQRGPVSFLGTPRTPTGRVRPPKGGADCRVPRTGRYARCTEPTAKPLAGRANRRGRRAGMRNIDQYTGEPLPPQVSKKGRPRAFWHNRKGAQPSDTKRAKSLFQAYVEAHRKVEDDHVFTPQAAGLVASQAFTFSNEAKASMLVCDGQMKLKPGVQPNAFYRSEDIDCVASASGPGKVRTYLSYTGRLGAEKKKAKRAAVKALTAELGRPPTTEEVDERLRRDARRKRQAAS